MLAKRAFSLVLAALMAPSAAVAQDNPNQPPAHTEPFPNLTIGQSSEEVRENWEKSPHLQRGLPAKEMLEQQRRLDRALAAIQPQRPGTIDAYVVTVALDSDPVFARESREAGRVLARRYNAEGRTLSLAGPDGVRDDLPKGTIRSLLISLARIAEIMDPKEDVLVMYTTSHGAKVGLVNHYGDTGYGILAPARLKEVLDELGIQKRLLIISACYSGIFIPELADDNTAILTAAAGQRTSFGCLAENDWTFYGDALINNALRKPQRLNEAAGEAARMIAGWEAQKRLLASLPQVQIGRDAQQWLNAIEARVPQVASAPVGRPSVGE